MRLVAAEGADTPRGCNNIVVSIHAIATFQALNDYLRPRLSGLLSTVGGSRLSGVLAALAAGRIPPGSLSRGYPDASAASNSVPPALEANSATVSPASKESKPERRRSLRLSAKASTTSLTEQARADDVPVAVAPLSAASTVTGSALTQPFTNEAAREELTTDIAASETAVNDDEDPHDEFMDADVDAEVNIFAHC